MVPSGAEEGQMGGAQCMSIPASHDSGTPSCTKHHQGNHMQAVWAAVTAGAGRACRWTEAGHTSKWGHMSGRGA